MVEKKKGKKRKEGYVPPGEEVVDMPSKEERKLANWMRKNVPIKKTKFMNHVVEYFTASKAIDALLTSKFASGDDALFTTREDVVEYLQVMLEHKFFHRARKIPVSEAELKGKKKDKKPATDLKDESSEKVTDKEKDKGTDAESSVVESKTDLTSDKVQRKRKIRLDMHNDQCFVDSFDAFVWIYDPIPFHYWIIGTLLVLGAIGVCLFPLWPPSVRLGVYYLSVAAAGFLVFILLLVIVRLIIFCFVWLMSAGKHHIWILPNLTEDVGFFASFWPLYKYEYKGTPTADKKRKKDKDSDVENDDDDADGDAECKTDTETQSTGSRSEKVNIECSKRDRSAEATSSQTDTNQLSESESESSQRSSTGKDFEIVDKENDFVDDEDAKAS